MFKEKKLTEKEVKVLSLITNVNHGMDQLIDSVNDLNILAMTIVAEKDSKNVTKEMIIQNILGHADISTTLNVYADATKDGVKESMESLEGIMFKKKTS